MQHFFPDTILMDLKEILSSVSRMYTLASNILMRVQIIRELFITKNNTEVARSRNVTRKTVIKWKNRFLDFMKKEWQDAWSKQSKISAITNALSDAPRSGTKRKFDVEVICRIMSIAVRDPRDFKRPISNWALTDLTSEIIAQGIVETIDRSTVGRILQDVDIRPHKIRYWLNAKVENEKEHKCRISDICYIYRELVKNKYTYIYSTDEKTGIQALERINPSKTVLPGSPEKIEFEYIRHGTMCLIPSFNVKTGRIDDYTISESRGEHDFANHIRQTMQKVPDQDHNVVWVMDQLNTHKSETLVRLFAEYNGITDDLGHKRKSGILKSLKTRQEFLENKSHRVRIVYTPKHCSWLNQVEIWFGILSRKLLKRLDCRSKDELRQHIEEFIEYFNRYLAKPYQWTYAGKALKK